MLEISNVIQISVSASPVGLAAYNPNNLIIFTDEQPIVNTVGAYEAYVSPAAVAADWGANSQAYAQAFAVFSQSPNILNGGGVLLIANDNNSVETAYNAVIQSVYFNGVLTTHAVDNAVTFASMIQAAGDKMWIRPSNSVADVTGVFSDVLNAGQYATRCLLYTTNSVDAYEMGAAYAGKAFSSNFDASNGTKTMNLKQLTNITPDSGITQTIYGQCATAGVDCYVQYGTVPAVASNGANKFFDQVYNLIWFVNALKVAGFNMLLQVGSKIPQTEAGMSLLKDAYRRVCEQALSNAYVAPGTWTGAERFGNTEDMLQNIIERGYYIYSAPVATQATADRQARKAPLIQIAIKEAGAVHSSNVVINVNP